MYTFTWAADHTTLEIRNNFGGFIRSVQDVSCAWIENGHVHYIQRGSHMMF